MGETRRGKRGVRRVWWAFATPLVLVGLLAVARGARPRGPNVHRPEGDCLACHTADALTLDRDRLVARDRVAADVESRCNACHGDQGPSHKTGVRPARPVPETLPLSTDGLVTCATCHFMHGEDDRFGDFVRIDNRRGGLCLTCHELSELE
jgi:hypothetical protein